MNEHTISYPNAKINLGLYVVERRPDGYHNIETVFYPIPLCDKLEITEDDEDQLLISGMPVAGELSDNLVVRVVKMLRQEREIPPLRISLQKNIPTGAGLGGGSADAAFTMKLLNEQFFLGMTDKEMEQKVAKLGADCAFFIRNKATMAGGIGNIFSPINLDLSGWHFLLVKPDEFVSTREAYSQVCPAQPVHPLMDTIQQPIEKWKDLLFNDFEQSVFPQHTVISDIKHTMYNIGATYASMSGSGSSVFGLFKEEPKDAKELFHPHFTFYAKL